MFDDLVRDKKEEIEIYKEIAYCPHCGSIDVNYPGEGIFKPGRKYENRVLCNTCGNTWWEVINENMEVVDLII